jgi:hypothetical protein
MTQHSSIMSQSEMALPQGPLRIGGIAVALLGVFVLVGWYAHWTAILKMYSGMDAMKFNTALHSVRYRHDTIDNPIRSSRERNWLPCDGRGYWDNAGDSDSVPLRHR